MKRLFRLLCQSQDFIWQFIEGSIRNNNSSVASFLRRKIYKTSCMVDTSVFITNKHNFISGQGSCLYHSCYILNNKGKFVIGNNSHLGAFCYVNVSYGQVTIGDDVAIGPSSQIIAYSNHYAKGKKVSGERLCADVIIKNNVFIGANCTILPGTIIHDNVIVAAGAVAKGELKANTIYGGVPAQIIKTGWYA